ncbi:MAG TPA: hypothetical protein VGC88_09115 [Terriglobales bacterium]
MPMPQGKYAVDNITYDLLTVAYEKSKALKAYEQYLTDAQADAQFRQLFERLRDDDHRAVQEIKRHLHDRLMNELQGQKAA